jgi:hypothetical protein
VRSHLFQIPYRVFNNSRNAKAKTIRDAARIAYTSGASPPAPVFGAPGRDGEPAPTVELPGAPIVIAAEFVPGCPLAVVPCVTVTGEPPASAWNDVGANPTVSMLPCGTVELTLQRKTKSAPCPACTVSGLSSMKLFEPVIAATEFPPVVSTVPEGEVSTQLVRASSVAPPEAETEMGTELTVTS